MCVLKRRNLLVLFQLAWVECLFIHYLVIMSPWHSLHDSLRVQGATLEKDVDTINLMKMFPKMREKTCFLEHLNYWAPSMTTISEPIILWTNSYYYIPLPSAFLQATIQHCRFSDKLSGRSQQSYLHNSAEPHPYLQYLKYTRQGYSYMSSPY